MNDAIDIVIPWVDGADPEWMKEKEEWYRRLKPDSKSNDSIRFLSWDNLKFLFRAIERFMPWANNIFLITCGQIPDFLKTDHPRLKLVNHTDYMPEEYLPTYNSSTIEMNMFRIPELSENFVYFNDDMFPLQPISEEYYFQDNRICDEAVEGHITPVDTGLIANMGRYMAVNNMIIINRYFNKRDVQEKNREKWFCEDYGELLERTRSLSFWYDFAGFRDPHVPSAFHKSTFARIWELEGETLDAASRNKFRAYNDVTQYVARYWQLCEGDFVPRRTLGKFYAVTIDNCVQVAEDIVSQKYQAISINEQCTPDEFEKIKSVVNEALETLFPQKCSFEV